MAVVFLPACSARIKNTPARSIAVSRSIPYKYAPGACLPFSRALCARMRAAKIEAKMLIYTWELPRVQESGRHAVVCYQDGGRTYVMDDQRSRPVWVKPGTPKQIAQQISGTDMIITEAHYTVTRYAKASCKKGKPSAKKKSKASAKHGKKHHTKHRSKHSKR